MEIKQQSILYAVKNYGKRLFSFIRSRVNNDEDAEDILQDVWYQLSSVIDTKPVEHLSAWLYRVSRNRIIDKKRKQRTLSLEDFAYEDENGEMVFPGELLMEEESSETEIEMTGFMEAVLKALNELPEKQRQVFIWNELDGLTLQQIADQTGENIKTIISRKGYAVSRLRELLQDFYDE